VASPYTNLLKTAAAQAQGILAPMADPEGSGDFTLGGTTYTGTIAILPHAMVPTLTGMEERREIHITATRAQFATQPNEARRPKFTARGETWTLTSVTPGAQFYHLVGVPA
jgi:hypothetical protein